jgi:thioredoxin 1
MASEHTKEFTDENFDAEVLKSDKPVLVDFWAAWCPPCRALTPTIDKIAGDYAGRVKVGKVDCEAARNTAMRYNINSIPAVLIFKNGQVVNRLEGLRREADYKSALEGL